MEQIKSSKSLIGTMIILIAIAAVYRVIPGRPDGFAPQIAMALFGGAIIKDKKWAFALPLFSMFLSDLLYQALFSMHLSDRQGFYEGQLLNYCIYAAITLFGFTLRRFTVLRVAAYSVVSPCLFFLLSNSGYWLGGGFDIRTNTPLDKSFAGLLQSLTQGLPFLRGYLIGTVVFSAILFGGYYLYTARAHKAKAAQA
ncbi:MAG TPA: DUF6580 family putative transport protein [Chitinophagaceae bacterium]|nr:DUF6580 family putative transport protein [Chitinophagaceae bacterium]